MIRERQLSTLNGVLCCSSSSPSQPSASGRWSAPRSESGVQLATAIVSLVVAAPDVPPGSSSSTRTRPRCCSSSAATSGTVKTPGLRWANPLYTKKRISLRVRNFESAHLKVNDLEGNPIEIAAVVVWRVVDTAEAVFEVDDYEQLRARCRAKPALRNLATQLPLRRARRRPHVAARQHRGRSPST